VVAVTLGPFVLTAVGLAIVTLRQPVRPATPPAVEPPAAEVVVAESVPVVVPVSVIETVEPGEARPPLPGMGPPAEEPAPTPVATFKGPKCERFGTAIDFVRSPTLACDRAAREQKLAMVLHLAGYFDDPGFT
jgi:hypothetical protein